MKVQFDDCEINFIKRKDFIEMQVTKFGIRISVNMIDVDVLQLLLAVADARELLTNQIEL